MPLVNVPGVGPVSFPDSMSQDQIIQAIERDILPNATPAAPEDNRGLGGLFTSGVRRGIRQLGVLGGDILPGMVGRGLGFDEFADRQFREARETNEDIQRTSPARYGSFEDIRGVGDALGYAAETVGEGLPSILAGLIPGGAGAAIGARVAGAGASAAARQAAIRQGAIAGSAVGAGAQNLPDSYQSIMENTGQEAMGPALVAGAINTALDAVLPAYLLQRIPQGMRGEVVGGIARRLGVGAGIGAAAEGATEGTQEAVNAAAEAFVDEARPFWSNENFTRVVDAAIRGGLVGGVVGGASDAAFGRRPIDVARNDTAERELQDRDLLGALEEREQLRPIEEAFRQARIQQETGRRPDETSQGPLERDLVLEQRRQADAERAFRIAEARRQRQEAPQDPRLAPTMPRGEQDFQEVFVVRDGSEDRPVAVTGFAMVPEINEEGEETLVRRPFVVEIDPRTGQPIEGAEPIQLTDEMAQSARSVLYPRPGISARAGQEFMEASETARARGRGGITLTEATNQARATDRVGGNSSVPPGPAGNFTQLGGPEIDSQAPGNPQPGEDPRAQRETTIPTLGGDYGRDGRGPRFRPPETRDGTPPKQRADLRAALREASEAQGDDIPLIDDFVPDRVFFGRPVERAAPQSPRPQTAPPPARQEAPVSRVEEAPPPPPPAAPTASTATTDEALPPGAQRARGVFEFDPQDITAEPEVFQFKADTDDDGVSERLRGVRQWDPDRSGMAVVYEYADGRRSIADGHQRLGLAKRLIANGATTDKNGDPIRIRARLFREVDGITPTDARVYAALKNIGEGSGTAIDAAKVMRDTGMTPEEMNLPPNSAIVQQALGLKALGDVAFGYVVNKQVEPIYAAPVGRFVKDPAKQEEALRSMAQRPPANVDVAESIARQIADADIDQIKLDLFGGNAGPSIIELRANVLARALGEIRRGKTVFGTLTRRADIAEGAGNKLDRQSNKQRLEESRRLEAVLQAEANKKGPLSDALTAAAKISETAGLQRAAEQFLNDAGTLQGTLQRGSDRRSDQPADVREGRPQEGRVEDDRGAINDPNQGGFFSSRAEPPPAEGEATTERADLRDRANKVIQDRVAALRKMGKQGEKAAEAVEAALASRQFSPVQLLGAFRIAERAASLLGDRQLEIRFLGPYLRAGMARDASVERLSPDGVTGLMTFSLADSVLPYAQETVAHEAFHVAQALFAASDKRVFDTLQKAFPADKGLAGIDSTIQRRLKGLAPPPAANRQPDLAGNQYANLYDYLTDVWADLVDRGALPEAANQRSLELQAYVFGALDDARRNGRSLTGITPSVLRFANFFGNLRQRVGSALRGDGFRSVDDILAGVSGGISPALSRADMGALGASSYSSRDKKQPTIFDDQRQTELPGAERSDKQAIKAREEARLRGSKPQKGVEDFGLFSQNYKQGKLFSSRAAPNTPEFKRWFGNSKVVDEIGQPLVVYHGTSKDTDFKSFKVGQRGAWFTTDPAEASSYATTNDSQRTTYNWSSGKFEDRNTAARVIPAYLSIQNPAKLTDAQSERMRMATNYAKAQSEIFSELRRQGYDGVDMGGGVWVAFNPTQIKSAIGNRGTFDPANPNIAFSSRAGRADVLARIPALEDAARGIKEGTATREQYAELVQALKPVRPYDEVPPPATAAEMRRALTSDKVERIGVPSMTLNEGDPVGLRLDIPAYANNGTWVVSVHEQKPGFAAGQSIGYESAAAVTNPTFGVVENAALNIASGKPKATIAVMKGNWKPVTPQQAEVQARRALNNPEWVQVGMDPTRHSYFYDRANMEPVVSADEAIQVGPLVLAKNPVYGRKEEFLFSSRVTPTNRASVEAKQFEVMYGRTADAIQKGFTKLPFVGKRVGDKSADDLIVRFQDRMLPVGRMVDLVREKGGKVSDATDAYMAEELYHGRAAVALEDRTDRLYKPVFDAMKTQGVSKSDLEDFLYARHAVERNAYIRSINEDPNKGSGMTDTEAAQVMRRLAPQRAKLEKVAAMVDAVVADTNRTRFDAGLIPDFKKVKAEGKSLPNYRHYVPLRGYADENLYGDEGVEAIKARTGSGFKIKGREDQRALGRQSRAANILENVILQNEEAVIRAEKNKVGQAFLNLVRDNPDIFEDTVEILPKAPTSPRLVRGVVRMAPDPLYKNRDDVLVVKEDGQEVAIKINDPRIAQAMTGASGLGSENVSKVFRGLATFNRYLAQVNTAWNPEFVITNFVRDLQTAAVNIQQFDVNGLATKVLKDVPTALRSVRAAIRETGGGDAKWVKAYEDFRKAGGKSEYLGLRDLDATLDKVNDELRTEPQGKAKGAFKSLVKFIEDYNSVVENGIRVATFENLRQMGVSDERAAQVAKNLTVNFNKGGENRVILNSLYLFYNASIQGTMAMMNAIARSPRVRKIVAGIVAAGLVQDVVNSIASGEDDDGEKTYDKIPRYVLEHNFVLMDPLGLTDRGYFAFPMPYGFNAFYNLGRVFGRTARGGYSPMEAAGSGVMTFIDAFNPIGGTENFLNFMAPTILDPIVSLGINQDFAGRPIVPGDRGFGPPKPDSQRFWNTTAAPYVTVSEWLNSLTGGSNIVPGVVDISPNVIAFLVNYATGGAGAFVERTYQTATDTMPNAFRGDLEELDVRTVPFARKLYGNVTTRNDLERFIENTNDVLRVRREIQEAQRYGQTERVQHVLENYPKQLAIAEEMSRLVNERNRLATQLNRVQRDPNLDDATKREIVRNIRREQDMIVGAANRLYGQQVAR